MTTPKPTPLEDASLLHSAALSHGDMWPIGWTADEAWHRLRAALERLEAYEQHPGIIPPKNPMPGGFSLDKFMPGITAEDAEAMGNATDAMDQLSGISGELDTLRAENAALIEEEEEEEVMSLFAAMIRTAVNVVTVPLAVVADAVTLCDGDNPDGGFTSRAIERLKRRGGAMTTPKPTPRDSIYRLLAATADSPAVETLQADCSEIIVALDELDTLRAERDDLKVKLEEAGELLNLKTMALEEEEEIGSEAESRATALAARVEALEPILDECLKFLSTKTQHENCCAFYYTGKYPSEFRCACGLSDLIKRGNATSSSTPAADLAGGKDEPH